MLALYFLSSLFCGIVAWINSLILPWLFVLPTSKTIKSPNNELRITGLSDNSWHSFFCFILCPVGGPRLSYFQSSYPFHTSFMFIIVELSFCPVAYLAFVTPAVPWPTTSPSSKKNPSSVGGGGHGRQREERESSFCMLAHRVILACTRRAIVRRDGPLLLGRSSVAIPPSLLALMGDQLTLSYLVFFACCVGDTCASDPGILSKSLPRLVTKPWKKVPPGTNGGVWLCFLSSFKWTSIAYIHVHLSAILLWHLSQSLLFLCIRAASSASNLASSAWSNSSPLDLNRWNRLRSSRLFQIALKN